MDPSSSLCLVRDSFNNYSHSLEIYNSVPYHFRDDDEYIIHTRNTMYCDYQIYEQSELLDVECSTYPSKTFETMAYRIHPFNKISKSIFTSKNSLEMANIDAVYNITPAIFTFAQQSNNANILYCDFGGTFNEYIRFRFPYAQRGDVNGMLGGANMSKCLYIDEHMYNTYDIVMGNIYDAIRGHHISYKSMLYQCYTGCRLLKEGHHMVLKCNQIIHAHWVEVLYILSQVFDSINIFKPTTSSYTSYDIYIICKSKRVSSISNMYIDLLEYLITYCDHNNCCDHSSCNCSNYDYDGSLIYKQLPKSFVQWITDINDFIISKHIKYMNNTLILLKNPHAWISLGNYNLSKFLTIWNLPSGPIYNNSMKI